MVRKGVRWMVLHLFEHNARAYQAAAAMLERYGKAAVVHPTGTGKSYIALSPAFLLRQLDEFKKASKPGISAAHHTFSERRPVVCRSALSARSPSAHGLPGRFAPDAPLQTASVYVKIVLDTQNCILFCVFKFLFGTFAQNPSLMFVGFCRRSPCGECG